MRKMSKNESSSAKARGHAALASQLMRDDVTKTKPCALRDGTRDRATESFREAQRTRTTHSATADTARCALRRLGVASFARVSSSSLPSSLSSVLARLVQDAVHIQGLAQPRRRMGEDGRGLGEEEDP